MPLQRELESFWQLSLQRPQILHGREWSNSFNAFADIEALLWLHYGVELGLFPDKDVSVMLLSERERLHNAVECAKRTTPWRCFPPRLQHFLQKVSQSLPSNNEAALDEVIEARYVDQSFRGLLNPRVMEILFHEIACANSNPAYCLFSGLITFAEESEWQPLLSANVDPDQLITNSGGEACLLCAGYFTSLDHMGAVNELVDYGADESRGDYPSPREAQADLTFLSLRDRIRSMHLWRLNLEELSTRERFLKLTSKIHDALASDRELKSVNFDPVMFLNRVEALCSDWLGNDNINFRSDLAA